MYTVTENNVVRFVKCFFSDDEEWNKGLIRFVDIKTFDEELRNEEYERVLSEVFDTGYPIPNVCEVYRSIEMIFILCKTYGRSMNSPIVTQLLNKYVHKAIAKIEEEAQK